MAVPPDGGCDGATAASTRVMEAPEGFFCYAPTVLWAA
jgi:hypothetical protein